VATKQIHPDRIKQLNNKPARDGSYVLYWMQQSQRAEFNHALEYAIQRANDLDQPCLVGFGLMDDYPEANARHYYFMLEGLQDTQQELAKRNIKLVVQRGRPAEIATKLAKDASEVICDRGYLRHQRQWREDVAGACPCTMTEVECDVIIPVETASQKAEWAARTIRPKLHKHLDQHLINLRTTAIKKSSLPLHVTGLDLSDVDALCRSLKLDTSIKPVPQFFKGGATEAKRRFRQFLDKKLSRYNANRNQPHTDDTSHMSPYLHFGQIAPSWLVLQATELEPGEDRDSFIEELLVRRELAMNFVYYTPDYDSYTCLPDWAQKTLAEHKGDTREYVYTQSQLENADTHDPYWNAAMNEMRATGYMHNYMRMYWGKKILEWTNTPDHGFRTALYLNNKYFLDGRDANSYGNVAWCFGLHDRAWTEREIFGKVRYMNANGLRRKCDMDAYIQKVDGLRARAGLNT